MSPSIEYRGFEIAIAYGRYYVWERNRSLHTARNKQAAMEFIDELISQREAAANDSRPNPAA